MDPISAVTAGLNVSIRLFEVTYQLKSVDEQAADLLATTKHVDRNLNEARRLRRTKASLLSTSEKTWMDDTIDDTDQALRGIARLVEKARVDQSTKKSINFGHRVLWTFRDGPQVQYKHQRLSICSQSLTTVIQCLYSKDVVVIAPAREARNEQQQQQSPPPYDANMASLYEMRRSRLQSKSSANLSSASIGSPEPTNSNEKRNATSTSMTSPVSPIGSRDRVRDSTTTNRSMIIPTGSGEPSQGLAIQHQGLFPDSISELDSTNLGYGNLHVDQYGSQMSQNQAPGWQGFDSDKLPTPPANDFGDLYPTRPPKVPFEHSFSQSDVDSLASFADIEVTSTQRDQRTSMTPNDGLERAKSSSSVDLGRPRRAGRGWLLYHATRTDIDHNNPL